jgi:hypothetical protein
MGDELAGGQESCAADDEAVVGVGASRRVESTTPLVACGRGWNTSLPLWRGLEGREEGGGRSVRVGQGENLPARGANRRSYERKLLLREWR